MASSQPATPFLVNNIFFCNYLLIVWYSSEKCHIYSARRTDNVWLSYRRQDKAKDDVTILSSYKRCLRGNVILNFIYSNEKLHYIIFKASVLSREKIFVIKVTKLWIFLGRNRQVLTIFSPLICRPVKPSTQ